MGIFDFIRADKITVENNRKTLSRPSEGKLPTDPWGGYSILFMGDYVELGKATKSMLKFIIDLEDIIRDIKNRDESKIVDEIDILMYKYDIYHRGNKEDRKLDAAEIVLKHSKLDNKYIEKILSLTSIDNEQFIAKYESIDQVHVIHLMNNLRFEFPNVYHNLSHIEDLYMTCIVIDILTGELPDIYNKDNYNDYDVETAKDIFDKFPIKGSARSKAEEKGYNVIIAAYCHSECTFTNMQLSTEILLELLGIEYSAVKDISNIDIYKVFKKSGLNIDDIHKGKLDIWAANNRELDRLINMIEYILNRRARLKEEQQYLGNKIYDVGDYCYTVADGFKITYNSEEEE